MKVWGSLNKAFKTMNSFDKAGRPTLGTMNKIVTCIKNPTKKVSKGSVKKEELVITTAGRGESKNELVSRNV